MHGRLTLLAKVFSATAFAWLIVGCEPPRVKSMESTHAATTSNPPRNFKDAPLDPYSWGGIAMSSGGRDPRTTYGALSAGEDDGVDEVYLPSAPSELMKLALSLEAKIKVTQDPAMKATLQAQLEKVKAALAAKSKAAAKPGIYGVPEPRNQNKVGQYVASRYLDNDGSDIVAKPSVINENPRRAGAVKKQPKAPAQGE